MSHTLFNEKVEIRLCAEEDVAFLRQFISTHWRREHVMATDEQLLRWQFDSSRGSQELRKGLSIFLAWQKSRIVGMLGFIPFNLNIRGTSYPATWMSQWLSIPEVRNHGIGLQLMRELNKLEFEARFALGINDVAKPIYPVLGYEMLWDMPRWIVIFDTEKTIPLLIDANTAQDVNALHSWCSQFVAQRNVVRSDKDVQTVVWAPPFREQWDHFWLDHVAPHQIGPNKDSSYLTWRYVDHPRFDYQIHIALQTGTQKILGMTVFRVERVKGSSESIVRVLELLSTPRAEEALAQVILQAASSYKAVFADFYCTSTRPISTLHKIGMKRYEAGVEKIHFPSRFQPLESGHIRTVGGFWLSSSLRAEIGKLIVLPEFYLTKSDGDQDRPN